MHFPFGKADDEGNLQTEDAIEFFPRGSRRWRFGRLKQGHPFLFIGVSIIGWGMGMAIEADR